MMAGPEVRHDGDTLVISTGPAEKMVSFISAVIGTFCFLAIWIRQLTAMAADEALRIPEQWMWLGIFTAGVGFFFLMLVRASERLTVRLRQQDLTVRRERRPLWVNRESTYQASSVDQLSVAKGKMVYFRIPKKELVHLRFESEEEATAAHQAIVGMIGQAATEA